MASIDRTGHRLAVTLPLGRWAIVRKAQLDLLQEDRDKLFDQVLVRRDQVRELRREVFRLRSDIGAAVNRAVRLANGEER